MLWDKIATQASIRLGKNRLQGRCSRIQISVRWKSSFFAAIVNAQSVKAQDLQTRHTPTSLRPALPSF